MTASWQPPVPDPAFVGSSVPTSPQPLFTRRLGPQDARDLSREVLLTDGLGGFALCSPAGVPTRTSSGLIRGGAAGEEPQFIAPLETLEVAGRSFELHAFELAPGASEGEGLSLLSHVDLNDLVPTRVQWAGGVRIERTWLMPRHSASLVLLYDLEAPQEVTLRLGALLTSRKAAALCTRMPELTFLPAGLDLGVTGDQAELPALALRLVPAAASRVTALLPRPTPQRVYYRQQAETERVASTDLWALHLPAGRHRLALVVGDPQRVGNPWNAYAQEIERRRRLILGAFAACGVQDSLTATLAVSADAFVSETRLTAGYPEHLAAGPMGRARGNLTSLGSLALLTGRRDEVRALLSASLDRPTHDSQEALRLVALLEQTLRPSTERAQAATPETVTLETVTLETVRNLLRSLFEGGRVDDTDGLLFKSAERGASKPIELQGLWIAALATEERLSAALGQTALSSAPLARARAAFMQFWNPQAAYYFDSLDAGGQPDAAVRAGALLALALPDTPSVPMQRDAALLTAGRELLTPLGLRSEDEDGRETVRPQWLGAYTELLLRQGRVAEARAALDGLAAHLWEAGLGSVGEGFRADTLEPQGRPFWAESVADLLRAHLRVTQAEREQRRTAL
ncbi:glycogen debranching enzyme N-terminal domain-containing protein [Deinococcus sp.]|uniref:glycogen debranching enzyme N-terminal domain-containing protein n=1 Tax=Deinococcus sp. TaxID=47478 RepID=UPI003CC5B3E0